MDNNQDNQDDTAFQSMLAEVQEEVAAEHIAPASPKLDAQAAPADDAVDGALEGTQEDDAPASDAEQEDEAEGDAAADVDDAPEASKPQKRSAMQEIKQLRARAQKAESEAADLAKRYEALGVLVEKLMSGEGDTGAAGQKSDVSDIFEEAVDSEPLKVLRSKLDALEKQQKQRDAAQVLQTVEMQAATLIDARAEKIGYTANDLKGFWIVDVGRTISAGDMDGQSVQEVYQQAEAIVNQHIAMQVAQKKSPAQIAEMIARKGLDAEKYLQSVGVLKNKAQSVTMQKQSPDIDAIRKARLEAGAPISATATAKAASRSIAELYKDVEREVYSD